MNNIRYLLKFGKKENIASILKGKLWFSTAETFHQIEDNLVRGQGDKLEAGMFISGTKVQFTPYDTGITTELSGGTYNFNIFMEPIKKTPVFCLFTCYDKDIDTSGNVRLSKDIQDNIREHFPEADAVAVIPEPDKFIENVLKNIHSVGNDIHLDCRSDYVRYFNMYGIDTTLGKGKSTKAVDMGFLKFITQDHEPEIEGNMAKYTVYESDAWRHLLCKDVFFQQEQEFRFILPQEKIDGGNLYEVDLPDNVYIVDLNEFFAQMI